MQEQVPDQGFGELDFNRRKTAFVLLLVLALTTILLGLVQIRNSILSPFALNKSIPPLDENIVNDVEHLRYRDTDFDGISDFDELYVFQTSPYLVDTDSDGISDGVEIRQGTNPLCAQGKDCEVGENYMVNSQKDVSIFGNNNMTDPGEVKDLSEMLSDPKQIRQLLKDSGVEESALNSISDKDLIMVVNEIFNVNSSTINTIIGL